MAADPSALSTTEDTCQYCNTHTHTHTRKHVQTHVNTLCTLRRFWSQSLLWAVWNIFRRTWSAVNVLPAPESPLNKRARGLEESSDNTFSTRRFNTACVVGEGASKELTANNTGPTHVCVCVCVCVCVRTCVCISSWAWILYKSTHIALPIDESLL